MASSDRARDRGTPGERVGEAVARWGQLEVVCRCVGLLALDGPPVDEELAELALVLGGVRDPDWLAGGKPPGHAYWARVWAARALRTVWDDAAIPAVVAALEDEHWRVREMAARVAGQREVADAADALVARAGDQVPRVRSAAARALGRIGEGEHAETLLDLVDDPEPVVARAAIAGLQELSRRLDRTFSRQLSTG